eukprot:GGOE01017764.1.p1 GENE.GGOE01017764.1~~GGOE01017764.1.p1  ORF type:complete len:1917 (-),score=426.25 GGOE01017764.1:389-6061(-)
MRAQSPSKGRRPKSPQCARADSDLHSSSSSRPRRPSLQKKTNCSPRNQVFLEWLELHQAVQRDFLDLHAPAAQLGQALQLACPKALKDADIAQIEFQRKVIKQTVPDHYPGYRLPWPLTESGVHGLLKAIKTHPTVPLHDRYVANVLLAARDMFERMPRVTEISVTSGKHTKLIIVGNLHGQLADLLCIWQKHGLPHPHGAQYVFNGGLVDHGEHGVEVLLLVLVFKLLYPKSVHINRGCHEDANANRYFGFFEEVRRKCGGQRMFPLFTDVFRTLPIATVVDRTVLIVHGGLSRQPGVLLDHMRGISMSHELPNHPSSYDEELLHDVMWSRAGKKTGVHSKGHGQTGIEYGPDVTEAFLKANHLHFVVRSRDVPKNLKGHHTMHHRKLWSIFSSSNFCGFAGNYGAVLELSANLTPTLHTHWAPPLASFGYGKVVLGLEKAVKRLKADIRVATAADVVRQVQLRIALHRQDLYYHFSRLDRNRTGTLGLAEWNEGLAAVLKLQLPWVKYRPHLLPPTVPCSEAGIDYTAFCESFPIVVAEPYCRWQEAIQKRIHRQLLGISLRTLQTARTHLTAGGLAAEELERLLSCQALGITPRQVQEYVRGVGRPHADALKFLRAIELAQELNAQTEIYETFQILAEGLSARHHAALDVFVSHDHGRCGALGYTQFINAMHQLQSLAGVHFSDDVLRHIGMAMYNPSTAAVDYLQAVDVMNIARGLQEKRVVQHVCNTLVRYNALFRKAFQILDYTGMGLLSIEEVMVGLLTVNTLLMASDKLSDEDIDTLATNTDVDGNRRIHYEAFLGCFALEGEVAHHLLSNTNVRPLDAKRLDAAEETAMEESNTEGEIEDAYQEEEEEEEMGGHRQAWDVEEPISLLSQGHISLCDSGPFNPLMPAFYYPHAAAPMQSTQLPPQPPQPPQSFQQPMSTIPPIPPPPSAMPVGRPLPPPLPPSLQRNAEYSAPRAPVPAGPQVQAVSGHGYGYPFAFVPPAPGYVPQQTSPPLAALEGTPPARYQQPSPPVTMLDHWAEDFARPRPWETVASGSTAMPPQFVQQLPHTQYHAPIAAPIPEQRPVFRYPSLAADSPSRGELPANTFALQDADLGPRRLEMPATPDESFYEDPGTPISAVEEDASDGEEEEAEEDDMALSSASPSPSPSASPPFNPVRGLPTSPARLQGPPSPLSFAVTPQRSTHSPIPSHPCSPQPLTAEASLLSSHDGQLRAGHGPWPASTVAAGNPPPGAMLLTIGPDRRYPSVASTTSFGHESPDFVPFAHPMITERIADPNSPPRPTVATPAAPQSPAQSGGSPQLYTHRIADPYTALLPSSSQMSPTPVHMQPMYFHSPPRLSPTSPHSAVPRRHSPSPPTASSPQARGSPMIDLNTSIDLTPSPPHSEAPSPVPLQPSPTPPMPSNNEHGSPVVDLNTSIDLLPSPSHSITPSPHPPRRSSNQCHPLSPIPHRLAGSPQQSPVLQPRQSPQHPPQSPPQSPQQSPPQSPPVTVAPSSPKTPPPSDRVHGPHDPHHQSPVRPATMPMPVEEEKVVYRIRYMTLDGEVVGERITQDDAFSAVPQGYNAVAALPGQRDADSPVLDNTSPGYSDGSGNEGRASSVLSSCRPQPQPTPLQASLVGTTRVEMAVPNPAAVLPAPPFHPTPTQQGLPANPPTHSTPSCRLESEIIVCSSPPPREDWEEPLRFVEPRDAPPAGREARAMPAYYSQQPSPPKSVSVFRYREDRTDSTATVQTHTARSPLRPTQTEPQASRDSSQLTRPPAAVVCASRPSEPSRLLSKAPLSAPFLLPDPMVDDVMEDELKNGGQSGPQYFPRINVVRNWRGEEFLLGQPSFEEDQPLQTPFPITRSALAQLGAAPGIAEPPPEDSGSTVSRFTRSTTLSDHRSIVW